jgi:beta-phosphoglucomutase-like phosphatase (HAD superfamily)
MPHQPAVERSKPAFLFNLDGTLIDSVYGHVLAWREALREWELNYPPSVFTAASA